MELKSLYNDIIKIGSKMLELGQLVVDAMTKSQSCDWFVALTQLHQRAAYYARLEALHSELVSFPWIHLTEHEYSSDPAFSHEVTSDLSETAYEILQALLEQNRQLEEAIHNAREQAIKQIRQVDQRKKLEQAYHPSNLAAGVWSQVR